MDSSAATEPPDAGAVREVLAETGEDPGELELTPIEGGASRQTFMVAAGGEPRWVLRREPVAGMSFAPLELELRDHGIGVSVICPGPMATEMARLSRPPSLGGDSAASQLAEVPPELAEMFASWGMQSPAEAGRNAIRGLADGEFYTLTHAQGWPEIETRFARIRAAFERRSSW
jgi:hypothetical protein